MLDEEVTDREITDYLLGVAEPGDLEKIEELSFADAEFSDRLNAVERELLDAYACGVMAETDRRRFESHYLASPLRREKLRLAEVFVNFATTRAPTVQPERTSETLGQGASWWSAIFGRNAVPQLTAAALLIVGGVMVWWLYTSPRREVAGNRPDTNIELANGQQPAPIAPDPKPDSGVPDVQVPPATDQASRQPVETGNQQRGPAAASSRQGAPNAKVFSLILNPPVRSGSLRTVTLPADADRVAVRLELESEDFASYSVTLREQDRDTVVWQSHSLRPAAARTQPRLNFLVPARLLKPQIYQFTVSGTRKDGSTEIIGDYPFKVVR